MKYYLNKLTNGVIVINNFDFNRENEDYTEITKDEYDKILNSATLTPCEEEYKEHLRNQRKPLLNAFDKWEKAVLRGREVDSEEIMNWYYKLLDLNEIAFESIPSRVSYYL